MFDELKKVLGDSVRINIRVDNTKRGISLSWPKEPTTDIEWAEMFEELAGILRAPTVPDPEVLGKYSP